METVIRALVVYFFLLAIIRFSGKRTLSDTSPFDMVLILILSETVQEALIDDDHSITNSAILIVTLVMTEVILNLVKMKSNKLEKVLEGLPVILIENGIIIKHHLNRSQVKQDEILEAARLQEGLENLEDIKYAILEKNGTISIIPKNEKS